MTIKSVLGSVLLIHTYYTTQVYKINFLFFFMLLVLLLTKTRVDANVEADDGTVMMVPFFYDCSVVKI